MCKAKLFKIVLIIVAVLIVLPLIYLAYDRSLMPPTPEYKSPPYVPGETWEQYATRFLATSKKPNALEYYLKAIQMVNTKPFDREVNFTIDTILRLGWNQAFPKVENAIEVNQAAIQEAMQGTEINQCELPPATYGDNASNTNEAVFHYRALAKLIALSGMKLEYENKPHEALNYYLAGIHFSKDMGQKNKNIVYYSFSISGIQVNTRPILHLISRNKLDKADYQKIITVLNQIEREQTSFNDTLEAELRDRYDVLSRFVKHEEPKAKPSYDRESPPFNNNETTILDVYFYFNRGRIMRNEYDFSKEMLSAVTTRTYEEFIKWTNQLLSMSTTRPITISPVYKLFAQVFQKAAIQVYATSYTRQMIEISLLRLAQVDAAIKLYHLQKKQWPKSLDDLKPNYLTEIPIDPFINQPFKLAKDETGLFAYSVGPDFVDNSAEPIYDPTNGTTSSGDIKP